MINDDHQMSKLTRTSDQRLSEAPLKASMTTPIGGLPPLPVRMPNNGPPPTPHSATAPQSSAARQREEELRKIFPNFAPGQRMNLVDLFIPDPIRVVPDADEPQQQNQPQLAPHEQLERRDIDVRFTAQRSIDDLQVDEEDDILPSKARVERWARGLKSRGRQQQASSRLWSLVERFQPRDTNGVGNLGRRPADVPLAAVDLFEWERDIVGFSVDGSDPPAKKRKVQDSSTPFDKADPELEADGWIRNILEGPEAADVDDEAVEDAMADREEQSYRLMALMQMRKPDPKTGKMLEITNLSNDHLYEQAKAIKVKMASNLGTVEVQHSKPALGLQMPFYRVPAPNKHNFRNLHRHQPHFPIGISIGFEKLLPGGKPQKSKNAKLGGNAKKQNTEIPATTKELTMADRHPIVLVEYSEERPPVLNKYGMGSVITNYYRKKDEQDESFTQPNTAASYNPMLYPGHHYGNGGNAQPKRHLLGQLSVMHPDQSQPYPLAFVRPGEYYQSLETNLTRAPIFEQKPPTTDFLVIRQTEEHKQPKYYIKAIDNIFTVGQTYPKAAVPTPTSNEMRDETKKRLYDTVRRLRKRSANGVIRQSQIAKNHPDIRELHIVLRIFMSQVSSDRSGRDRKWKLAEATEGVQTNKKPLDNIDDKVFTPDEHVLIESSHFARQMLEDAGYRLPATAKEEKLLKKKADMAKENDEDVAMPLEVQLAPWYTTQNYFRCAPISYQGGAFQPMLELSGPGDPTGRREGFSMLEKFKKQAQAEYADWLKEVRGKNKLTKEDWAFAYESEQRDIWEKQRRALSNPVPPDLSDDEWEDEEEEAAMEAGKEVGSSHPQFGHKVPAGQGQPMSEIPTVLRIERVDEYGQTHEEVITDEAVITAYLVKKGTIDPGAVTSLIARNPQRLSGIKAMLAQYARTFQEIEERKAEAAAQKEKMRAEGLGDARRFGPKRPPTCQECGQVGHTKKQKDKCPGRPKGYVPSTTPGIGRDTPAFKPATASSAVPLASGGSGLKLKIGLGRKDGSGA